MTKTAASRTLGVVEQTPFNWVKAQRQGKLAGADSKAVSAEQIAIGRLPSGLAQSLLGPQKKIITNMAQSSNWQTGREYSIDEPPLPLTL